MQLVRDFYKNPEAQAHYAKRVKVIVDVVKGIYGESFNLEVFLPKVQELARCEIAIRYYSKLLANERVPLEDGGYSALSEQEKKETRSALREDRQREAVLWEHLGLKMAGIEKSADRRDTKDSDNFEEHMFDMMEAAEADDELELEGVEDEPVQDHSANVPDVPIKEKKELIEDAR